MNAIARALLLLVLLTAAAVTTVAQIGADPNMVYIRVKVADPDGRFVTALRPEAFKIEEDKIPQQIVSLSEKNIPISVAIMVDIRGTLKDTLKTAALSFLSTGIPNPADQLFVMESGAAPLHEAVLKGLNELIQRGTNPIRAFVLLTDRENPGTASFSKVKDLLKDQDVEFFVGGVPGAVDVLRDLAKMSGGEAFFPAMSSQLPNIGRHIHLDLRHQYLIGYRPTNLAQDGKWRKITITGKAPNPRTNKMTTLTFRMKPGYYAPTVAGK